MKILELFGGIGACSKAFKRLGIDIEIADYVEIDKYAVKSYNAINGTNFEPQDITKWDKDIEVDFIMHGSPCQDFSLAGLNKGGDKDSGTRSSLMYETIRIVEKLKPKYVLWENVKNLLSKKHIHNFKNYISIMNELGYNSYYQVLNSKNYGIPQNRERVFTLSIRQDIDNGTFTFPKPMELKLKLKDMLENQVDEKYFLSDKMINYISQTGTKDFKLNDSEINLDIARPITTDQNKRAGTTNYLSDDLPDNFPINKKQELCDYLIQNNMVKENDMIRHSYTKYRMRKGFHTENSINNNISATMTTRPDTLGVVVKKIGHIPQWHQRGGIYDSEGIRPTLCSTDYKTPKLASIKIKNNTKQGYLETEEGDGINISSRMHHQRGNVQKEMIQTLDTQVDRGVVVKEINKSAKHQQDLLQSEEGLCRTIPAGTHGSTPHLLKTVVGLRIRKLTPKECWRLMGFDDTDFEKAEKVNSNAQLYKQAGNSIVVNVLEAILTNLFLKEENDFEGQMNFNMLGDNI